MTAPADGGPPDLSLLNGTGVTPGEVAEALRRELDALDRHLSGRSDWSEVQPDREWSPAQEAEHVLLVADSSARIASLLLSDRELRPVPQEKGEVKGGKRQAPPALLPSAEHLSRGEWAARRDAVGQRLDDLAQRCTTQNPERRFWHPFLGELNALDWLRMNTGHIRHHRELLECSHAGAEQEQER